MDGQLIGLGKVFISVIAILIVAYFVYWITFKIKTRIDATKRIKEE